MGGGRARSPTYLLDSTTQRRVGRSRHPRPPAGRRLPRILSRWHLGRRGVHKHTHVEVARSAGIALEIVYELAGFRQLQRCAPNGNRGKPAAWYEIHASVRAYIGIDDVRGLLGRETRELHGLSP